MTVSALQGGSEGCGMVWGVGVDGLALTSTAHVNVLLQAFCKSPELEAYLGNLSTCSGPFLSELGGLRGLTDG